MRLHTVLAVAMTTLALGYLPNTASATSSTHDLAQICDSARLTELDRRECRAQFKTAADDAARLNAFKIFEERINGPITVESQRS